MSKLYAVALALLVLAVPAMAYDNAIDGVWEENIDLNITVAPMVELWHSKTAVDLEVRDAATWWGEAVMMQILGNIDFDVYLDVDGSNLQDNVLLEIVTEIDNANWLEVSDSVGETLRRYDPRNYPGVSGTNLQKLMSDDSNLISVSNGTGGTYATRPKTYSDKILTQTATTSAVPVWNLYSVTAYSGAPTPTVDDAGSIVTVKYTITPAG